MFGNLQSARCDFCNRAATFAHVAPSNPERPGARLACQVHGDRLLALLVTAGGSVSDVLGARVKLECRWPAVTQ